MVLSKKMTVASIEEKAQLQNDGETERNAQWNPAGDYTANPMSPSNKEKLRSQALGKQYYLQARSTEKLKTHLMKTRALDEHHGPERLDTTKLLTDTRVQALMAPPGVRRQLATNVADHSVKTINVNHLRFQREQKFADGLLRDAGGCYEPTTCVGNWVEDRRDERYRSGWHSRELGFSKIYQSEHMERYRPHSQEYRQKFLESNLTAKIPRIGTNGRAQQLPPQSTNEADGSYVYYTKGFGETPFQDHTSVGRRGVFWLGTEPVKKQETITGTVLQGERLEFQNRCSLMDPKSKVLTGTMTREAEAQLAAKETTRLIQTERYTPAWKTMYHTEINMRSTTPLGYRPTSVSAEWSSVASLRRPTTSAV